MRIKCQSYWEFLAAVFQCEDSFICASFLSSMLAVNVETQSFVYTWKQTYTNKTGEQFTVHEFSVAEPALCEHTWVNWFESSHIQSLPRHGLQCETKFAAAVCVCVCGYIYKKKVGEKCGWNGIFWEHAPRSLITFAEVQYWKRFHVSAMKWYTSHDLMSHCFNWCMDIWSGCHDSCIIDMRY